MRMDFMDSKMWKNVVYLLVYVWKNVAYDLIYVWKNVMLYKERFVIIGVR